MKTPMNATHQLIKEATGVSDTGMLDEIEDTMRNCVFHSTLDWQTREQFIEGARIAYDAIQAIGQ